MLLTSTFSDAHTHTLLLVIKIPGTTDEIRGMADLRTAGVEFKDNLAFKGIGHHEVVHFC